MKLAIMQPYIFPYIGYFQLINSVDSFVLYDDVNYIKQGWINRNNILNNGNVFLFTIPLSNSSSFSLTNEITINQRTINSWIKSFDKNLSQTYNKSQSYKNVKYIIDDFFVLLQLPNVSISEVIKNTTILICNYLEINTQIVQSSNRYNNSNLKSVDRILDCCASEKATTYINASGGQKLYSKQVFNEKGIELKFIQTNPIEYKQQNHTFVPNLSIIDVLMFNTKEEVQKMLNNYTLI
jgi:hypothetical protein